MTASPCLPVSVIVPCHNADATVERAIESITAQTRSPAQVIVVDDASTDGTADVLGRSAKRRWPFTFSVMTQSTNIGPGEARNKGWEAIGGRARYVAFLDADDAWLPRKLEQQVGWMETHPEAAWTAHRCTIPGDRPRRPPDDAAPPGCAAIATRSLLIRNNVATPTVVARAAVRGRFRRGWRHCEDLMLWLDWLDEGARGVMLDLTLARLGRVPGSQGGSTGDRAAMHRGEQRVIRTLCAEGRMSEAEAAAWRGYALLRYQRRQSLR